VLLAVFVVIALAVGSGITMANAVLHPRVDSPARVDGIVVVAGALDDRYVYARHLAESGVADQLVISYPDQRKWPDYAAAVDRECASNPIRARDGRSISVSCFSPDPATTEGETRAATAIARERGWHSLLVVTYWGHVSRARLYFDQCFDGDVHVTDTPRPLEISRRHAVVHESGGYVKALVTPAC